MADNNLKAYVHSKEKEAMKAVLKEKRRKIITVIFIISVILTTLFLFYTYLTKEDDLKKGFGFYSSGDYQ